MTIDKLLATLATLLRGSGLQLSTRSFRWTGTSTGVQTLAMALVPVIFVVCLSRDNHGRLPFRDSSKLKRKPARCRLVVHDRERANLLGKILPEQIYDLQKIFIERAEFLTNYLFPFLSDAQPLLRTQDQVHLRQAFAGDQGRGFGKRIQVLNEGSAELDIDDFHIVNSGIVKRRCQRRAHNLQSRSNVEALNVQGGQENSRHRISTQSVRLSGDSNWPNADIESDRGSDERRNCGPSRPIYVEQETLRDAAHQVNPLWTGRHSVMPMQRAENAHGRPAAHRRNGRAPRRTVHPVGD